MTHRRVQAMAFAVVLMATGTVAVLAGAPAANAASVPIVFAKPVAIDTQPTVGISCATTALCVGVDTSGNVVVSTNPTGGAPAWTISHVDPNPLTAISCPTVSLCIATDDAGNVVTSTNPTGRTPAWTVTNVDGTNSINAISCPGILCVAADAAGHVVTTIDPTGGARLWSVTTFAFVQDWAGVSCVGLSCVAVATNGRVATTTNPTGGAGAWTFAFVDTTTNIVGNPDGFTSISCPTAALCVAPDSNGNVFTTTNPSGGAPAWTAAFADPAGIFAGAGIQIDAVSCPTTTLCLAVDQAGNALTSINPTGGASAWTKTSVDDASIRGISCVGTTLCVAFDTGGYVISGTKPPVPAVTSITPTSGPTTGGTHVTITGTGFSGATTVTFGAAGAPAGFILVSATKIVAVAPPTALGPHNIFVTTVGGTSAAVPGDIFTFTTPPPAVTAITPTSGPTTGGTHVTITGTSFTGATKVAFGAAGPPATFTVVSATKITAVAPATAAGAHNVFVTSEAGTSAAVAADVFTFTVPAPRVTAIAPTSGPTTGGTTVTITGVNFTGATKVAFGATAAKSFHLVSATKITAVSPAAPAGARNILVTTAGGTSAAGSADVYTFKP